MMAQQITPWMILLLGVACSQRGQLVDQDAYAFCLNDGLREQLVLDTLHERKISQHLRLTGEVSYNPDKVVQFASLVEGVVVDTRISLGDHVKKGQRLATISSPELNTMQAELKGLEAQYRVALREYEAAQSMYEDQLTAERELIQAKAELEQREAHIASIKTTLNLFHPHPADATFEIRSPIGGYVVEKNINPGMPISQGSNLFTISGLDEVWVMLNVYATDMPFVKEGMDVDIQALAYPGEVFRGRISALSQVFDNLERVLKARVVLRNEGLKLKPGMSVDAEVEQMHEQTAVALPADAVIFDDNQYFAVVYGGDCDLQLRRLTFNTRDHDWYFIEDGLVVGEQVVRQNHLLIYERIKAL